MAPLKAIEIKILVASLKLATNLEPKKVIGTRNKFVGGGFVVDWFWIMFGVC